MKEEKKREESNTEEEEKREESPVGGVGVSREGEASFELRKRHETTREGREKNCLLRLNRKTS